MQTCREQKSEASIRSYSRSLSEEKQQDISNSLSHYCGFPSHAMNDIPSVPNPESEPAVKVPRSVTDSSSSSIEIPSQKYRSALDTVLHSPLPCSSLPGSPVLNSYSHSYSQKKHYEKPDCFIPAGSI